MILLQHLQDKQENVPTLGLPKNVGCLVLGCNKSDLVSMSTKLRDLLYEHNGIFSKVLSNSSFFCNISQCLWIIFLMRLELALYLEINGTLLLFLLGILLVSNSSRFNEMTLFFCNSTSYCSPFELNIVPFHLI